MIIFSYVPRAVFILRSSFETFELNFKQEANAIASVLADREACICKGVIMFCSSCFLRAHVTGLSWFAVHQKHALQYITPKIQDSAIHDFSWYLQAKFRQAHCWHSSWQLCIALCAAASIKYISVTIGFKWGFTIPKTLKTILSHLGLCECSLTFSQTFAPTAYGVVILLKLLAAVCASSKRIAGTHHVIHGIKNAKQESNLISVNIFAEKCKLCSYSLHQCDPILAMDYQGLGAAHHSVRQV